MDTAVSKKRQIAEKYLAKLPKNIWPNCRKIFGQIAEKYLAKLPKNIWPNCRKMINYPRIDFAVISIISTKQRIFKK
ncbi:MAG: hypothetical protein IKX90_04605 [Verrucomicrobia bacterium]|nr:hypothetical protein [Verrucomicrobiota bacterium]